MTTQRHIAVCDAPICASDPNPNFKKEVIWHVGEKVCLRYPLEKFQKKQQQINKDFAEGTFKVKDEEGYTAHDLETRSI